MSCWANNNGNSVVFGVKEFQSNVKAKTPSAMVKHEMTSTANNMVASSVPTVSNKEVESVRELVTVKAGWLRENVERIAKKSKLLVIWNEKIPSCLDWKIEADYTMPEEHISLSEDIAYLFDQYPLIPRLNTRDKTLVVLPLKDFQECPDV